MSSHASTKIDQKAYLKKYLSGDKVKKKKKKDKKHKSHKDANVKIIDDNAFDGGTGQEIDEELLLAGDDAPQIVGEYIEERPNRVPDNKWRNIAVKGEKIDDVVVKQEPRDDDNGNLWGRKVVNKRFKDDFSASRKHDKKCRTPDISPVRKRKESVDLSPSRHKQYNNKRRSKSPEKKSRKYSIERTSPGKRHSSPLSRDQRSPRRRDRSERSPLRRQQRDDNDRQRRQRSPNQSPSRRHALKPSPTRNNDKNSRNRRSSPDQSPPRPNASYKSKDRQRNHSDEISQSRQQPNIKQEKRRTSDQSPPRRNAKHASPLDQSPPRRRNFEKSPSRKAAVNNCKQSTRYSSDLSPRRRQNSKLSPSNRREQKNRPRSRSKDKSARKRQDFDQSPPRNRNQRNSSEMCPYQRISVTPPPNRSEVSPTNRRRSNSRELKFKKRRISDQSPPRNANKRKSPEICPYQRISVTPPRQPSQRKSRWGKPVNNSPSPPPTHKPKTTKTLDGKKAGLQGAKDLIVETEERRRNEERMYAEMPRELSGRDAELQVRSTGRRGKRAREAKEEDPEVQRRKEEHEQKKKEKYDRWGIGLKQIEDYRTRLAEEEHEASKPLARYANDEDLDRHLREQERLEDPMLEYMRKKRKEKQKDSNVPTIPVYEGPYPENRFGIRPGYRWDGVDRSNGYENKWFAVQNERRANQEDAYKYSVEDM